MTVPTTLLDTRAELVAILEGTGLRTHEVTDGRIVTPCAIVDPGQPWSARAAMVPGGREVRWRVTILAARIDNHGSLNLLATTADQVMDALDRARDWGTLDLGTVRALELAGATYLAADLVATTIYSRRT